ncbi:MAG: 3-dehydroquinate synthase [Rhodothermales bacterium]
MPLAESAALIDVKLQSGAQYPIHFEPLRETPRAMTDVGLRPGRCLVVTDKHVGAHYLEPLTEALGEAGWTPRTMTLDPGEEAKSYAALHRIYDEALAWGIDRKTPVLALGGGVVGDVAGFAAATLLRGLPLVQLPTSLVAQVDSAVGGKTGINHTTGKNLIGAFHQPRLVLADPDTLSTLPQREWTSGLAEVVKHALILDPDFFAFLETNWTSVIRRDPAVVRELVPRAAQIKVGVVGEDELEAGRRAILNFGHTFGHAIERTSGYGTFTHGEAVALGMRAVFFLSQRLYPALDLPRLDALVAQIPITGRLADLAVPDLMAAMQKDKKVEAGEVRFVVLERLGQATVRGGINAADIEAAWAYAGFRD